MPFKTTLLNGLKTLARHTRPTHVRVQIFVGAILAIGLTAVFLFLSEIQALMPRARRVYREEQPLPTPAPKTASPSLRSSGNGIAVTNKDDFEYKDVEITINPATLSSGYICEYGDIAPGATKTEFFGCFANSDHQRFNLLLIKPETIRFRAKAGGNLIIEDYQFK